MEQETELTQIHGRVIEALDLVGIDHSDEYHIEVDDDEFDLDCYLPSYHACVEADGPSHGMRGRKDRRRNEVLLNYGIPTLRLTWRAIESVSLENLAGGIMRWAERWEPSIRERKLLRAAHEVVTRAPPRDTCTCPDDHCLRHEDIGGW